MSTLRPSSSPTPYSVSLPDATSPHHHRAAPPRGPTSAFAQQMHQLATSGVPNSRNTPHNAMFNSMMVSKPLRPLPQAVRPSGLVNMMIQGHSAGEPRVVAPTEPRVPLEKKSSAPLDNGANKEVAAQRDTAKIRKLEQELAKIQELLKKRTGERDKANSRIGELETDLAAAKREAAAAEAQSQSSLLEKGQQIVSLQLQIKQLEEKAAKHSAEAEMSKSKHGRADQELEGFKAALAQERKERADESAASRQQIADLQKRIDDMGDKKRRSSSDFQAQLDKLAADLASKTREATNWETEAAKLKKELSGQEASFSEWKTRIEAINEYILKICQPQFSVVKDESLAPIAPTGDPAASGQEGYVLVPLPLMLQGYTLLPQELKKKIANEYEANKKDFAAAIPRRASRN